ncbi:DMT family transporter [Catenuloplanes atrovinosus]|uniref:Drug/metabolite transporter (DMT)-like permease n=1 Tax=Catenuloplanes atrovinosus TaxID=137266 RepID=A0AAE3YXP7_9ACTN|nr:DMT family transporter [Catenuloplanes atrovinosus]MDR7279861.1 drug/metabolite transporter (DMT)-like permease [Catenuloplanes atrovinosus]
MTTRSWLPGYLALAAVWGASFLFIGIGVRELHPVYVTLFRVVAGALTLAVVLLLSRDRLPRDPVAWGHLFVIGVFGVTIPFTLFGYGEQRVSSGLAGIWNATTPLLTLPIAALVLRTETLTARRVAGVGVGFLGVLVVLGVWDGVGGAQLSGQLMCLGAAACYGFAIPYQKRFLGHRPDSSASLAAGQLLMATVQLLVAAPLLAGAPPSPLGLSPEVIGSVLALGVFGTGLAFLVNMRNIRVMGASAAASVTYLIPLFAVLLGVLVLDEHISWHQPAGAVIVLAGVAISTLSVRPSTR